MAPETSLARSSRSTRGIRHERRTSGNRLHRRQAGRVGLPGVAAGTELTAPIPRQRERVLPAVVDELGRRLGDKPALLSDRECLTYLELAGRARRYSRWALAQGVAKGDVVGLLMPNRPEYLAIWLGVTRVGESSPCSTPISQGSLSHAAFKPLR